MTTAPTHQPLTLVTGPTDTEMATAIRTAILNGIEPLLAELTAAKRQGFDVTFAIQTDAQGKSFLQSLRVMKEF